MPKQLQYLMNHRGSTSGAKTGKEYTYEEGQPIVAPEGEFRHLPQGSYRTADLTADQYEARPLDAQAPAETPEQTSDEPGEGEADEEADATYRIDQKGRYFYVIREIGGEEEVMNHLVREDDENKGLDEEAANELLNQLQGE